MKDANMLLVSLREHFPARKSEWAVSGIMILWGFNMLIHPQLFTQPQSREMLAGLRLLAWFSDNPHVFWGWVAILGGLICGAALVINGFNARTPFIRMAARFLSILIWTLVCIGMLNSGVANTGWPLYCGLVVLDIMSVYQAAGDAVYAERARLVLKTKRPGARVKQSAFS